MQNLQQTGQDNQEGTANESKNQDTTEVNVDNAKPIIDKKENSNKSNFPGFNIFCSDRILSVFCFPKG
jgi:hypothetical protein